MDNMSYEEYVAYNIEGTATLEEMPLRVFLKELLDQNLSEDELRRRLIERTLPKARDNWPDSDLLSAAQDYPVAVKPNLKSFISLAEKRKKRVRDVINKLSNHDLLQTETEHLKHLYDETIQSARDDPLFPVSPEKWATYRVIVAATKFARENQVPGISEPEVKDYLYYTAVPHRDVDEVFQSLGEHYPALADLVGSLRSEPPTWLFESAQPQAWVNLARRPVTFKMEPGSILIDVTHATQDDLSKLWSTIFDIQQRLGHQKNKGGRPVNAEVWQFAAKLKSLGMTDEEIADELEREFPRGQDANGHPKSWDAINVRQGLQRWNR